MTKAGSAQDPGETRPIRAATTLILWRPTRFGPEVLMGRRGAGAAFMASKFVFPGGAVDPEDVAEGAAALTRVTQDCARRLALFCPPQAPDAGTLVAAGLRELVEETGLTLAPDAAPLRFVFRAVTPPGRTRRFDARFLLADGGAACGDVEAFSAASAELSDLQWIGLDTARRLDLPFVTEVVLAELAAGLRDGFAQSGAGVPFFDNSGDRPVFRRLV